MKLTDPELKLQNPKRSLTHSLMVTGLVLLVQPSGANGGDIGIASMPQQKCFLSAFTLM